MEKAFEKAANEKEGDENMEADAMHGRCKECRTRR